MEDIRQLVQYLGVRTFTLVGTAINKKLFRMTVQQMDIVLLYRCKCVDITK